MEVRKNQIAIAALVVLTLVPLVLAACGSSSPAASQQTVTLADDGKTISLRVGESFLLKLGEDYDWTPIVADQTIVSRAMNIAVIRGAQGVYDAHKAGKTTLTATGDPVCRQATPPCEQPSRTFTIQIVVQ
jgi:hypothetical protein